MTKSEIKLQQLFEHLYPRWKVPSDEARLRLCITIFLTVVVEQLNQAQKQYLADVLTEPSSTIDALAEWTQQQIPNIRALLQEMDQKLALTSGDTQP